MKFRWSVFILLQLLVCGCGLLHNEVDFAELVLAPWDNRLYERDTNEPFTGRAVKYDSYGTVRAEYSVRNGVMEGAYTFWYSPGYKREQGSFREGSYVGRQICWYKDGGKSSETFRDDHGVITEYEFWNRNGVKMVSWDGDDLEAVFRNSSGDKIMKNEFDMSPGGEPVRVDIKLKRADGTESLITPEHIVGVKVSFNINIRAYDLLIELSKDGRKLLLEKTLTGRGDFLVVYFDGKPSSQLKIKGPYDTPVMLVARAIDFRLAQHIISGILEQTRISSLK